MTDKKTARREALKALAAAAGVVTLAALPKAWESPVLEVGALPAHAQTSAPPTIDNLQLEVSPSQACGDGLLLYTFFITYEDPAGGIEPDSLFTIYDGDDVVFQEGLFGSDFVTGSDGFSGALEIPVCLFFVSEPGIRLVSSATGLPSNILQTTVGPADQEESAVAPGRVHWGDR